MRHLTPADYVQMPWANGRGQTIEMMRATAPDGGMLWRISMATVTENGPFSIFPGVDRNLTVIDGPGFDLTGSVNLRADPLHPVAFPGDVSVAASGVTGTATDFNVMVRRGMQMPEVQIIPGGRVMAEGAMLCLFALNEAVAGEVMLGRHDLLLDAPDLYIIGGPLIAVRLWLSVC